MAKFRPIWSHWLQPITWLTVSRPNEMSEIEFTLLLGSGGQPCKHSLNKVKSLCYVNLNKFSFCNGSYLAWLTTSADSPSLNNGPSPTSFWFTFSVFFKQTSMNFLQQIDVKNVHPVYCAGIRTHDLQSMSHRPYPQDQGSSHLTLVPMVPMKQAKAI